MKAFKGLLSDTGHPLAKECPHGITPTRDCPKCHSAAQGEYLKRNREKHAEYMRLWRAKRHSRNTEEAAE